jgi:hypothetical protein
MTSLRSTTLLAFVSTLVVAGVLAGSSHTAEAGELHVETDVATTYTTAPSFRIVSETSNASNGRLGVGYDFGDLVPGLRAYLLYGGGSRSASHFDGDLDVDWKRNLYLTGLGWGYEIGEVFRPFLRTLFGYAHQRLELDVPSGDYAQIARDFAVLSSGGFELYFPYQKEGESNIGFSKRLTIGFDAEFGYLWQTPATYDNLQRTSDDWQRSGGDVGVLNANGLFWSAGIFARFRL